MDFSLVPKSVSYFEPNLHIWKMILSLTINPLHSHTEAIGKISTPKTAKQCKSFCGVVNYLSLFCADLQTLLKPIVELTCKGRPFIWGPEQEKASPPLLFSISPVPQDVYTDTSIEGTGGSLWQI